MLDKYKKYYTDNPHGLWFKRRLFGWGWVPVKWQGWAVLAAYLAAVLLLVLTLDESSPSREVMFMFGLPIALLTVALIRICYAKGERPRWQWGLPDRDSESSEHDPKN